MVQKRKKLGELLLEKGLITVDQLDHALNIQKHSLEKKRIGEVLVDLGMISEMDLLHYLSDEIGLDIVDLDTISLNMSVVSLIPKQLSLKYGLIACDLKSDCIVLAVSDPLNYFAFEDIKSVVNKPQKIVLALSNQIHNLIDKCYSELEVKRVANKINASVQYDGASLGSDYDIIEADDDTLVVNMVQSILIKGKNVGASDIHIEPFEFDTSVRLRIDGLLLDYLTLSNQVHNSLVSRIKILSDLDIAEKRVPQDGHFKLHIDGQDLNIRVSTLPMLHGEKVVLRFLNSCDIAGMSTYGMSLSNYKKLECILKHPNGVIYITGPTGSGKTTTLYSIIEKIAKDTINVSTIEDPIERPLTRINQTQVNTQSGMSFAVGLRALMRQDPDVIMVGETRDTETAQICVTAAITGHLVLSTLHTNDACSTITRIEDMGIEPYMVAAALKGVVAQRLVKKICPNCKESYTLSDSDRVIVGSNITIAYKGLGCSFCNHTGYKGRQAVHEILEIDEELRKLISKGVSTEEILEYVTSRNTLKTLKECTLELIESGLTTIEELTKVAYVG